MHAPTPSLASVETSQSWTVAVAALAIMGLVFGAGTFYLLRLMRKPPGPSEPDIEKGVPTRAAGITPAPALGS